MLLCYCVTASISNSIGSSAHQITSISSIIRTSIRIIIRTSIRIIIRISISISISSSDHLFISSSESTPAISSESASMDLSALTSSAASAHLLIGISFIIIIVRIISTVGTFSCTNVLYETKRILNEEGHFIVLNYPADRDMYKPRETERPKVRLSFPLAPPHCKQPKGPGKAVVLKMTV